MLASLLFPYDLDAPKLINKWLCELEKVDCIVRYSIDEETFLEVKNWRKHQKIDKPSPSKIPPFDEASRIFDEASREIVQDQGPRIKDQGSRIKEAREQVREPSPNGQEIVNEKELLPTDPEEPGWPKPVDLQIAVNHWNETAASELGLAKVLGLSEDRKKHLSARLKEVGSLGEFFWAVDAIKDQPFLRGSNDRNWRASFDWFLKPSNFSKVRENTYDRGKPNGRT